MSEYTRIETGAEVWAVLRARHSTDMVVYATFSDPDGGFNGGPGEIGRMDTSYALKGADFPFIEAESRWTIDPERPHVRIGESHRYWLVVPVKEAS
jgi:hypothetical protein